MTILPDFHKAGSRSGTPTRIILFLVAILSLVFVAHRTRRWYRLRHVPGPLACGLSSLPMTYWSFEGRIHEHWKALAEKYGPLVRIGPNEVMCTDGEVLRRILSVRSTYKKDDWYIAARTHSDYDNILSMRDKDLRRERKKKLMPAYIGKGTEDFEIGIDRSIAAWMDLIDRKYLATGADFRPLDLALHTHYYSLDALGEVAYSRPLGYLAADSDVNNVIAISKKALPLMIGFGNYTPLYRLLHKWPFSYVLPRSGDQAGLGAILGISSALIEERLRPDAKPQRDMLQCLISSGLTREELDVEVGLQFFAGTDSIASAIRMTLLFLISTPSAYRKLQSEIDTAKLSTPIRNAEAQALPYLQAVIHEGLRVFPPIGSALAYKNVPAGGDTIAGCALPAGTRVATGAAIFAMCRSKDLWGPDADVFRPERWLEAGEEEVAAMGKVAALNFSGGQFECPGRVLTFMHLNKVIPELLRRYDLTVVNPVRPARIRGAMMWLMEDMWIRVEKRQGCQ
ncbi:cytochrome P450 [Podospora appendiculata]|uniref:Cytochrome P450 n=1 Tax=Podospora appendiculata TaxID=314037 RepID=A0AAE0XAU3_9PEZI|nr:cytochrome P450 [Podospora appendiculata]